MVGEKLHLLRDTAVTLGTGPEVLWTTGALCRVLITKKIKAASSNDRALAALPTSQGAAANQKRMQG